MASLKVTSLICSGLLGFTILLAACDDSQTITSVTTPPTSADGAGPLVYLENDCPIGPDGVSYCIDGETNYCGLYPDDPECQSGGCDPLTDPDWCQGDPIDPGSGTGGVPGDDECVKTEHLGSVFGPVLSACGGTGSGDPTLEANCCDELDPVRKQALIDALPVHVADACVDVMMLAGRFISAGGWKEIDGYREDLAKHSESYHDPVNPYQTEYHFRININHPGYTGITPRDQQLNATERAWWLARTVIHETLHHNHPGMDDESAIKRMAQDCMIGDYDDFYS